MDFFLALYKMRDKTMCGLVNQVTFSCNTDCCQDIVTSTHDLTDACFREFIKNASRAWFQFVFEDNEAEEVKTGLCFLSLHLLNFHPIELLNVLCSASNDPETSVCIVRQKFFIIVRY